MMKCKVFQSVLAASGLKPVNSAISNTQRSKSSSLLKLLVFAVSISFIMLNTSASYAQVAVTPPADPPVSDPVEEPVVEEPVVEEPVVEEPVVEEPVVEDEEPVAEEDSGGGGGGGGGGAILAILAVGAVGLLVFNNANKKPKIQKTFISDQVAGKGTLLTELTNQSSFLETGAAPSVSLQYGSYESVERSDQPYSFFNIRYSKSLGSLLRLNADAGTRYFSQTSTSRFDSQWLSFGLTSRNLFDRNDSLTFTTRYAVGDLNENSDSLNIQGVGLLNYDSLFSDQNSRFELAYNRVLGQNQRLQFLVQKLSSSNDEYAAKLAWRYAF